MGFNAGEVFVLLGGRLDKGGFQQFDRSMKESAAKASSFEKALGASSARSSQALSKMGHAAKIGAAGGVLAFGAAVVYSVRKAADFQQQLSALGAVSNASGRQMQAFKKQAMDAGAATKYSALEAAQAQTELAKGGLSVSQILKGGLKGALALAAAGELDLADAASYTVNALKLFKLDGDRAVHVADALATAANDTTADVQDFGAALTQGGGAARSAGYSFNDTVTILEALAQVGVKNSDAGTSMKTALLQLIGPTKKQADVAKEAGLNFLTQSGEMKDIADISGMLRSKTQDMTKAQRTQLFQTLAGTDGFRTLLALYDAGPGKLEKLERNLQKQGTAADVAAKKQDNLKGKLENLQGSVETAAITVGTELIPVLEDAAEDMTDFVNKAAKNGDIKEFGQDLASGFKDAADAVPDVISTIGDIGEAAGTAISAVKPLIGVIGSIDPHILAGAALGFAGFKVAQFVAPGIAAVASAMSGVGMAARTAPSIGAFFGDVAGMIGPTKLIIGGMVAVGAAIAVLSGQESDEAAVAHQWASAKKEQAAAAQAAADAIRASADTGLSAKQSQIDAKQAHLDAKQAERDYKDGKIGVDQLRQARLNDQQASLRVQSTAAANRKSIQDETDTLAKNVEQSKKRRDEAQKTVDKLQGAASAQRAKGMQVGRGASAGPAPSSGTTKALALAQKALNQENEDYIRKLAIQKTAEASRQRLMQRSTQITEENASGVSKLIQQLDGVDPKKQAKILLDDQGALSDLGNVISRLKGVPKEVRTQILTNSRSAVAAIGAFKAIQAGVPAQKVTKILANTNTARGQVLAFKALVAGVPARKVSAIVANTSGKAEVDALRAAIDALHSKTVTTTNRTYNEVINKPGHGVKGNASGRRAGAAQPSLVGEGGNPREYVIDRSTGSGYVTSGPMFTQLGADDYVIPVEDRFRGRALGLFASLAKDLGVPGYKKGKKAKGKTPAPRVVPAKIAEGGVPFDKIQSTFSSAKSRHDQAEGAQKTAAKNTHSQQHRLDRVPAGKDHDRDRSNARDALKTAKRREAKADAREKKTSDALKIARQDLEAARKYDTQVKQLQSRINVLRDEMELADRANDGDKFNKLKAERGGKLTDLQKLLKRAQSLAKGSNKRDLNEQLSGLALDIESNTASSDERDDPTAFTQAEQDQVDALNAKLAVAELTDTVEGEGEDRDLLTQILGIDQAALARAKAPGTPSAVLQAAAEAVKSTQDQLTNLTSGGGGTSDQADLQAQLDQANERTRVAQTEASINAAALTAGFGPGGSAGMVQNNYMLHPSDPSVLRTIGSAAMAGVSYSGGRQSPRLNAGI